MPAVERLHVELSGAGLHEITGRVDEIVSRAGCAEGLFTVIIAHTSASLLVQENDDPQAALDLEAWLCRLVPENDPLYTHTAEGPDDMPSHIKNVLTETSLAIPVVDGRMALGTWQGIYLWEHRDRATGRRLVVAVW